MGITCPACGSLSRDQEFCDHCNADLLPPASSSALARCPLTAEETVLLSPEQVSALARPEAAILVWGRNGCRRAHWIPRQAWESWQVAVQERLCYSSLVLPPIRVVEEDAGVWVLAEVAGKPARPWELRAQDPLQEVQRLCGFLESLARSLEELHQQKLIWLTFDPKEIEEISADGLGKEGSPALAAGPFACCGKTLLRFTNLDLTVYPSRQVPDRLQVDPVYAPPEAVRFRAEDLGPATDVYHLALFAYYWLAGLLPGGFPGNGLEAFGHVFPSLRIYERNLLPGIAAVLARGLSQDSRQRFPSPGAFCAALHKVLKRNEQRWTSSVPVRWEIGSDTRAGRAKEALSRDNEDHLLVRRFSHPERALVAVADGITSCEVGSGALASLITCLLLENAFAEKNRADTFSRQMGEVCRKASESLLAWALEKGYRHQLISGLDLMGTTLLAGWLEGQVLTLANVGDSRAYLIDGPSIEQLTVDGDLGNELLAAGVPPEEVKALGGMARGLRDCVGGCLVSLEGEPKILEEYCRPSQSRWPLLPGDILVLCSDGLVEEGAFLEPETVGEIVRSNAHLPAQALACQLAAAADALQRLPSPKEPDGFGDNISCIVIKINKG